MSRQFSEDMEVVHDVAGPAIAERMKKLKREHAAMKKYLKCFTTTMSKEVVDAAWSEVLKQVKL